MKNSSETIYRHKWKDERRVSYDNTMKQIDEEDKNRGNDYENK